MQISEIAMNTLESYIEYLFIVLIAIENLWSSPEQLVHLHCLLFSETVVNMGEILKNAFGLVCGFDLRQQKKNTFDRNIGCFVGKITLFTFLVYLR